MLRMQLLPLKTLDLEFLTIVAIEEAIVMVIVDVVAAAVVITTAETVQHANSAANLAMSS